MINKVIIFFFILFVNTAFSGVTIVGTRFTINQNDKYTNIKIINDNENEYLIKSEIDDSDFIISPPLFLISKNSSKIITIVPTNKLNYHTDKIINLTIIAIPKSEFNNNISSISLAIRSHFKLIFRHAELKEDDFKSINIVKENNQYFLFNKSKYVFTISIAKKKPSDNKKIFNIPPNDKISLNDICNSNFCDLFVNFYNENNDVVKTINLSYK
ncbi:fimbria/pilus periplasmic chaperone [Providencia rettgeri]|nr:fimbria/pilus periplasmic chaperone [Providencia rettgeri]